MIMNVGEINTKTEEGKLLLSALAIITTEVRTNKTPEQVIAELYYLWDKIDGVDKYGKTKIICDALLPPLECPS